ncbi:MAG: hypothetical protein KGJ23_12985 [Euryarchaeota archaeon]|nr:hypothetical protein [Euryarchaeota archaeon]MDE1837514.1 hypothetical protein [Euryarchaeota archaeon]MDE2045520.1 hypothetical protein [Thermoplasmata archaeon]
MPGVKVTKVALVPMMIRVPKQSHDEMVIEIEASNRWVDRSDFVREAIREKVEREKAKRLVARSGPRTFVIGRPTSPEALPPE